MNSRWMLVVLGASLAINLVLVGLIGGFAYRMGGPPQPITPNLHEFVRELNEDQKKELRERMRAERSESRKLRREVMRAQQKLTSQLKQEVWDETEIRTARNKLHNASRQLQEHLQTQMIMVLAELEPEERRRVLKNVAKRHWERKRRGRNRHNNDAPPG